MDLVTFLIGVVIFLVWLLVGGLYLVTQTLGGRSGSRTEWWEEIIMLPIFAIAYFLKVFTR